MTSSPRPRVPFAILFLSGVIAENATTSPEALIWNWAFRDCGDDPIVAASCDAQRLQIEALPKPEVA